jgi:hypothetical protein
MLPFGSGPTLFFAVAATSWPARHFFEHFGTLGGIRLGWGELARRHAGQR